MEEESLDILRDLRDSFKLAKKQEVWHKHPVFISVVTLLIGMFIVSLTGYATLPSDNKRAIENHIRDDKIKWNATNVNTDWANSNFRVISDELGIKLNTVKQIDNE